MLHAVIRSDHDALHFIGEVNLYNLETVEQHVRSYLKEGDRLELRFEVDPKDRRRFEQQAGPFLSRYTSSGIPVEVRRHRVS